MRRLVSLFAVLSILLCGMLTVSAENGNVTYSGDAGEFIFAPGSEYSPTDLFPNFKDVMPGDRLTQTITVKNDASNKVKVKIYMRSLGAHEDSVDFLSQMNLKVDVVDGWMDYMFDAAADETAQLTDWVCLGTLYSGGVVDLEVILDVPVTMGNEFQEQVGYLDWQFKIEEFPVEEDDPKPPQTGDDTDLLMPAVLMGVSVLALIILVIPMRKKKEDAYEG